MGHSERPMRCVSNCVRSCAYDSAQLESDDLSRKCHNLSGTCAISPRRSLSCGVSSRLFRTHAHTMRCAACTAARRDRPERVYCGRGNCVGRSVGPTVPTTLNSTAKGACCTQPLEPRLAQLHILLCCWCWVPAETATSCLFCRVPRFFVG